MKIRKRDATARRVSIQGNGRGRRRTVGLRFTRRHPLSGKAGHNGVPLQFRKTAEALFLHIRSKSGVERLILPPVLPRLSAKWLRAS